jgi:hypothetical protein
LIVPHPWLYTNLTKNKYIINKNKKKKRGRVIVPHPGLYTNLTKK